MGNLNKLIYKPVTTSDVSTVLNHASHNVKTLCQSPKINIFAAYKPFERNSSDQITDDDYWKNGYGLRCYTFTGTPSQFATAMKNNMQDEEWMNRYGMTYQKVTTWGRLGDFVSKSKENVGYYHLATLDEFIKVGGDSVSYEYSTDGMVKDATVALENQPIQEPNWTLIENGTVTRSDKNANIFDVMASTIANPHTNYINLKNYKRGVMVMTPYFTNPHFAIGSIPWKTWGEENIASGTALFESSTTPINEYPVVDFLIQPSVTSITNNSTTQYTFYVLYASYQQIRTDFSVFISINKNPYNGKFEIFVTIDQGMTFNKLNQPTLKIGFWNNNTFDLFTSPNIASTNSNTYYWEGTVGDYLGDLRVIFTSKRRDGTIKEVYEDWY